MKTWPSFSPLGAPPLGQRVALWSHFRVGIQSKNFGMLTFQKDHFPSLGSTCRQSAPLAASFRSLRQGYPPIFSIQNLLGFVPIYLRECPFGGCGGKLPRLPLVVTPLHLREARGRKLWRACSDLWGNTLVFGSIHEFFCGGDSDLLKSVELNTNVSRCTAQCTWHYASWRLRNVLFHFTSAPILPPHFHPRPTRAIFFHLLVYSRYLLKFREASPHFQYSLVYQLFTRWPKRNIEVIVGRLDVSSKWRRFPDFDKKGPSGTAVKCAYSF